MKTQKTNTRNGDSPKTKIADAPTQMSLQIVSPELIRLKWHKSMLGDIQEVIEGGHMMLVTGSSGCGLTIALRRLLRAPLEQSHGQTVYLSLGNAPSPAALLCKLNDAIAPGTSPRDVKQHSECELEDLIVQNILSCRTKGILIDHAAAAPIEFFDSLRRIHGLVRSDGAHQCGIVVATASKIAEIMGQLSVGGSSPIYLFRKVPAFIDVETTEVFTSLLRDGAEDFKKSLSGDKSNADAFIKELQRETRGSFLTIAKFADRYRAQYSAEGPTPAVVRSLAADANGFKLTA